MTDRKKKGKAGRAAGDPSYARLHGAARDLSFIQPAASAAEQDMGRGCFGSHSWRQELPEGAIHWHREQPAHGGCQARLHVTVTRHNRCVCTDTNPVPLCLYPKHPKRHHPALSQAALPSATPNWALLLNTNKQSRNFATCDDPDPKKAPSQRAGPKPAIQKTDGNTGHIVRTHRWRVVQSTQGQG